ACGTLDNMIDPWTHGQLIAELRAQRGWSQRELADRVGVASLAVSKWENNQQNPSTKHRLALAEVFGLDAGDLGVVGSYNTTPVWAKEQTRLLREQSELLHTIITRLDS